MEQGGKVWGGLKTQPGTSPVSITHASIARRSQAGWSSKAFSKAMQKPEKNPKYFHHPNTMGAEFKLPERPSAPGRNEKMYFKAQQ